MKTHTSENFFTVFVVRDDYSHTFFPSSSPPIEIKIITKWSVRLAEASTVRFLKV
ncbi:hypothetical protein D3C80_2121620 [compost metagenome]